MLEYEQHDIGVRMIINESTTLKEYQSAYPHAMDWTESEWEIIKEGRLKPKFTINDGYPWGKKSCDLFVKELLMSPEELAEKYNWLKKSKNTSSGVNWNDKKFIAEAELFFEKLFREDDEESNDNHI